MIYGVTKGGLSCIHSVRAHKFLEKNFLALSSVALTSRTNNFLANI